MATYYSVNILAINQIAYISDWWWAGIVFETLNTYSNTKKEPKSDARLSEFDWHDLSPIFLAIMLLHNLKVF